MMWWYEAIVDWMLENPDKTLKDCAAEFNSSPVTIGLITRSDMFKERLAARRAQRRALSDEAITTKLSEVAFEALGHITQRMREKRDQIPLQQLESLATSALDRLGYSPKQVGAAAPQGPGGQTQVFVSIGKDVLAEARGALRQKEAQTLSLGERAEGPRDPSEARLVGSNFDD